MEQFVFETPSFWEQVAAHPISRFVGDSVWAYPILETVHMFGLAFLFGAIVFFDLRVLGFGASSISLSRAASLLLPWVLLGFLLNLVSGSLLFASNAVELSSNRAFQLKVVLIVLAAVNAMEFMARRRSVGGDWSSPSMADAFSRGQALLSILLWSLVIIAGRFIAYFE